METPAPTRFEDIRYETSDGIAKLTINRPEVRNAFRPKTLFELSRAFDAARDDPAIGVDHPDRRGARRVLLGRRPAGPRRRRLLRRPGHRPAERPGPPGPDPPPPQAGGGHGRRLRDRRRPRPAPGVRPDHRRGQRAVRPDGAAWSARSTRGYGSGLLARTIGLKRAKEVWFLCEQYDAETALGMGPGQPGRAAGPSRGGDRRGLPPDARDEPARAADAEGRLQRRHRRAGRHPAARRRRHPPLST